MTSNKEKLKERLLEIPLNNKSSRGNFRLASDLVIKLSDLEILLNELCNSDILTEKIEYICPTCGDTTILDKDLLEDISEDNCFECDGCTNLVRSIINKTGFKFYDVKDKQALINW